MKPHYINIAIVDDHVLIAEALTSYLNNDKDLNVYITANNGLELLDKIDKALYKPDICIIDIIMPVMNGYETTQQIKKKYPHIHVLAVTAVNIEQSILLMIKFGAGGYILKNSTIDIFKEALTDLISTGVHYSTELLTKYPQLKKDFKNCIKKTLSDSDIEFLSYCGTDMTYEVIAKKMYLSKRAIEHKFEKVKLLTGIHTRQELAAYAVHAGFTKPFQL